MSASTLPADTAALSPRVRRARDVGALCLGFVVCIAVLPVHLDRAFGLPAHPLLLHVPVIFDPILAVASLVFAIRPALRRRVGLAWAAFAIVCLFATVLTAGAGDAFIDKRPFVEHVLQEHRESGETLRLITFGLAALIVALVAVDWAGAAGRASRVLRSPLLAVVLSVFVGLLAIGCGFMTVRTGHLGAKSTWARDGGRDGPRDGGPRGFPPAPGVPPIRPGSGQP